jgi:thiol-disulfide isomerase/thioredoxin
LPRRPENEMFNDMKKLLAVFVLAALTLQFNLSAQTNAPATDQLHALFKQVQAKLMNGQNKESDFTAELAQFDSLLAAQNGAKTDEAAQIAFMKAQLYLEIFDEPDKGKILIEKIKADYPDTKIGKRMDDVLASLDRQAGAQKLQAALAPGLPFPDFSEKDLSGNPISVGALKGKIVLVDFWATWCGPCREELPNVIATYKKYHAQGFDIIGVSLDSERDKLDDFLKQQDGMTWPQFFDGQGWGNALAVKYGVQAIPFAVLVGPDGKILANNLRGEALGDAVEKALAKK